MAIPSHVLTLIDPCPQAGRPCEVAQALLETLASAMAQAGDVVGPGFSMTGAVETRACGPLCRLHWTGTDEVIEVGLPSPGSALRAERLRGRLA
jgi:hypothetical protein